jgi:hypothetical protein
MFLAPVISAATAAVSIKIAGLVFTGFGNVDGDCASHESRPLNMLIAFWASSS